MQLKSGFVALCGLVAGLALAGCDGSDGNGVDSTAGVLEFSSGGPFIVGEDGVAVTPVVVRRTGGTTGAVSATVMLAGVTATGGSPPLAPPADFDQTPILVAFADGDASDKTVVVPILADGGVEADETIALTLSLPTGGAVLGGTTAATVTITNDDFAGVLEFIAGAFSYSEDGAAVVPVVVRRTGGVAGAVSAALATSDGTANSDAQSVVEPLDYAAFATPVSFADGDAADKTIIVTGIVQDALPELDESILLTLSTPTGGAAVGPQSTATLTIIDDDTTLTLLDAAPASGRRFGSAAVAVAGKIAVGAPRATANGFADAGIVSLRDPATGLQTATLAVSGGTTTNYRFGSNLAAQGFELLGAAAPANFAIALDVRNGALVGVYHGGVATSEPLAVGYLPGRVVTGFPGGSGLGFPTASGMIQVYDHDSQALEQTFGFQSFEGFGADLAVHGDRLVVGGPNHDLFDGDSGIARIFVGSPPTLDVVIDNPFSAPMDHFGAAVAISDSVVAVGAPDDDAAASDAGAVYLFNASNGAFITTVLPPTPVVGGGFGSKIAIVRDRFAIRHSLGGVGQAGQVIVIDASGTVIQTIANPTPQVGGGFGSAMAEFDGALVVGAPLQDVSGNVDTGIAYVVKVD